LIREDHYTARLLTLKTVGFLFEELKERYLTLITDIIPYVTDCLEDSNETVHNEAYKTVKNIEKITGEDFKSYLES
jgi:hypothetical protein